MKIRSRICGILLSVTMLSSLGLSGTFAEESIPSESVNVVEEPLVLEKYPEPEEEWSEPDVEEPDMDEPWNEEEQQDPVTEQPDPASEQTDPTSDTAEAETVQEMDPPQEQAPDGFSEENGLTIFSEENAELLYAEDDKEGQDLIDDIQAGEMIALAVISPEAEVSSADPGFARASATATQYRMVVGDTLKPDEVTKQMQYREIVYTDGNGKKRTSPIYCLNASKEGIDSQKLKEEAIKTLKNSTIQKLLYFGYGGPGDISDSYDPTCQHIKWSNWVNRYVFTHMALSKVYSKEYGRSSEEECEHSGVNRYLAKIKSLKIPARDGVVFQTKDRTGNLTANRKQTVYFHISRNSAQDPARDWADQSETGFTDGFMVSDIIRMTDTGKAGNTITIARPADAAWQMGYWINEEEYTSRGDTNPRILGKGKSVVIKSGYVFRILMPLSFAQNETWTFSMSLNPVTYLFVDGSIQTGEDVQDFGTCVYQGTAAKASLTLVPDVPGSLTLLKKDSRTGKELEGASYGLYASEDIMSGDALQFSKDACVAEDVTNAEGIIIFRNIPAGNYYVKEISPPVGYLSDSVSHQIQVQPGENSITLTDTPDLKGKVSIQKVDKETSEELEGAIFTIYPWNETLQAYTEGRLLTYDGASKRYLSDTLHFSPENQGKFQIKETSNPAGYTGSFTKELTLQELNPGEEKLFEYRVENTKIQYPHIEVLKIDAETGKNLSGAEFTLYEWDETAKSYPDKGTLLTYDPQNEKYLSGDLKKTERNLGKFKVAETKNPEGYEGTWEKEVTLSEEENVISYTVPNRKIGPPKGRIWISKKDSLTGKELSGAEFRIYSWNHSQNAFETDEKAAFPMIWDEGKKRYDSGEIFLTAENRGRFLIKETKNPEGYTGNWSKEVTLTKDGQSLSLTAENTPILGQITIVKKLRTEDITWAHGNPTFLFAVTGKDRYGIVHTYETTLTFLRDAFSEAGEGYGMTQVTIPNIPLGEYQVYEKPVLRYYLKDAQANTGNVAITRSGASGYGSDPKLVAYGVARLSPDACNASITFINEKSRYDGYSHNSSIKNTIPITFE